MVTVFKAENIGFCVRFNDSPAAQAIIQSLPLESTVCKWGDEIYFETGIKASTQGQTKQVEIGDIAYWPEGRSLCVFFGPTLASVNAKPVPASPVVVVGKTLTSPEDLRGIKVGEKIKAFVFSKRSLFADGVNLYEDTRKLLQHEIDQLVTKVLQEKK